MAADFYSILDNFKNFIGGRTGLFHWCLFCLAVVMLFFLGRKYQEEKQTVRFLVWPTILVLLFLFNPLFYRYVGSRFFAGVYWRLFWMLPVSFTAAYVAVSYTHLDVYKRQPYSRTDLCDKRRDGIFP